MAAQMYDLSEIQFENEIEEKAETLAIMFVEDRGMDGAISGLSQVLAIVAEESPAARRILDRALEYQASKMASRKK